MTFTKYLNKIKEPQTMVMLNSRYKINTLADLFAKEASDYVTYRGSLTTPPCTENVQWIGATKPLYITQKEVGDNHF